MQLFICYVSSPRKEQVLTDTNKCSQMYFGEQNTFLIFPSPVCRRVGKWIGWPGLDCSSRYFRKVWVTKAAQRATERWPRPSAWTGHCQSWAFSSHSRRYYSVFTGCAPSTRGAGRTEAGVPWAPSKTTVRVSQQPIRAITVSDADGQF